MLNGSLGWMSLHYLHCHPCGGVKVPRVIQICYSIIMQSVQGKPRKIRCFSPRKGINQVKFAVIFKVVFKVFQLVALCLTSMLDCALHCFKVKIARSFFSFLKCRQTSKYIFSQQLKCITTALLAVYNECPLQQNKIQKL